MAAKKTAKKTIQRKDEPLGWKRETVAMAIAGRAVRAGDAGPVSVGTLRKLVEAAEVWANRLRQPVVVVPAGDPMPAEGAEDPKLEVVIGLRTYVASADEPGPTGPLDAEVLRAKVEESERELEAVFWEAMGAIVAPSRPKLLAEGANELWFVATGPKAGGYFGFGMEARGPREGFEFFRGSDMQAEPHPLGVLGVQLVEIGGGKNVTAIDLRPEAHVERVAKARGLDGTLGYWFSARHG